MAAVQHGEDLPKRTPELDFPRETATVLPDYGIDVAAGPAVPYLRIVK